MVQLRACGIVVLDGRLLQQRKEHDSIWALPGGKLRDGEQAAAALMREFSEELGVMPVISRTVWIVENNFAHDGKFNHQVEFYFEATLDSRVMVGLDPSLMFQWVSADDLADMDFRPSLLRDQFFSLPQGTVHLVIG